jgi:hypothetical protein
MVATSDLVKGMALWILAFSVPILLVYLKNPEVRIGLITLAYPIILASLARTGRFWVSKRVIVISALVAFGMSMLLRFSTSARAAIDKPDEHKVLSSVIYSSILIVFFLVMALTSMGLGMYGSNVNVA